METRYAGARVARIGVLAAVALFGARGEASASEPGSGGPGLTSDRLALVPGFSVRNGDWLAVDGLGIALLTPNAYGGFVAVVARGEIGIGGVSAGIGLATNVISAFPERPGYDMSDFLGSGLLSVEMRVERMYGLTGWRSTTYVGAQVSLGAMMWKPSVGWMVDAYDSRDGHLQITFLGGGW